jgi:hypothetical protein
MAQVPANPQLVGHQQPTTTYQAFYDGMPDTLNGEYTGYLEPFGPESGTQPATLRDRIIATPKNDVPKVYAMLQDKPAPRIMLVHRPTQYVPLLLGAQPWDDRIFGLQGDLHPGNQINTIEWPVTPFARTVPMTVPVLGHMDAAWATTIGDDVLEPFNINDPDTEQLRARLLCPVPHRYVPLCLGCTYTPRAFWTDVIGQVAGQNQQIQDCMVLGNWAGVASTFGPAGPAGQNTLPLGVVGSLRVPLADGPCPPPDVGHGCILEDLPALGRTGTTLERQFVQQNATLGHLLQCQQVDDAATARHADRADKEFTQVLPTGRCRNPNAV